ncbi:MAG: putative LPS assembly protein LptD [Weeksellaceae bacterium]
MQVESQEITLPQNDSIINVGNLPINNDTIKVNTTPQEQIQDIIDYQSEEQYFDVQNNKTYLVNHAKVLYLDMEIEADYIEVDLNSGDIYAVGKQDSTGKVIESSIFRQGDKELEYGSFTYNLNTKQGKAFNVRTEESMGSDRGVVVAGVVKQYNDTISGMRKIAYTTDEYFIDKKDSIADYHLEAQIGKFIKGKENKIITGPIFMKIYDIPTPLGLPFAFLPTGSKRSAGILLPSFGEQESQGFYLQGLGLYLPIGEYLDVALTGDIYTKGSLGLHALSNYKKRYKFNGSFNFDWYKRVNGIKGLSNYSKSTEYNLRWSHRQDQKANPNLIFNASVSLMSSTLYQNALNNYGYRNGDYLRSNANSTISLNKNWPNSPFNANLTLTHSQNLRNQDDDLPSINLTLPNFNLNMNRIYPFAPKAGVKKGLIQSLSLKYDLAVLNRIETTEEDFLTKRMFDNAKLGANNTVGISTGTTIFNYFPITISANYNEVLNLNTERQFYDARLDTVVTRDVRGFKSFRTFGTSASISTTLYGTKIFGSGDDDKLIKAVRHMITPSVSFGYTPDFGTKGWGYYKTYIDKDGNEVLYNPFEHSTFSLSSGGLSQNLSFSIGNNLELKVRDRESPEGFKKIKIFESFNISSGYNFAAETFKLSPIQINGSSSLFNNEIRVTFGATLDPYKTVYTSEKPNGIRVDELGTLKFTSYNVSTSYTFNQDFFGKRELNYDRRGRIRYEDFYFDQFNYAQFLTPWNLTIGLNHSVSNLNNRDSSHSTSLRFNGSISPTPHWAISGRTSFDVENADFNDTFITFSRDLRSFIIDFSMVPFGRNKSWDFFIGIKANILRETIKYEERNFRTYNNNF